MVVVDYLNFAQDAFLLFEVGQFSYSLKNQNHGYKKIYTIDTGLRNSVSFSFSQDEGRLVENIVFVSILQLKYHPYYWNGKNEVDFVVQHRDYTVSLINVCYSDDIPERELKGMHEFSEVHKGNIKARVIITKDVEKEEDGVMYIPLVKWLLGWNEKILKEGE